MARNRNRRRAPGGGRLRAVVAAPPRLRGRGVRALRRRLGLLLLLALLAAGVHAAWNAARRSPYFRVQTIEVADIPRFDRAAVIERLGLDRPTSIFAFDPAAAEEALEAHPWVRSARVEKRLPGTVRVRLTERRPAAVVAMGGLYLVDDTGRPFVRLEAPPAEPLPLITGLTREAYEADPEQARERLVEAMALARLYEASPAAALRPLGSVHLGAGERMNLMLGRTRVSVGRGDYRRKLDDLVLILKKLDSRKVDAAYILMDEAGQRAIVKEIPVDAEINGTLSMRAEGVND